MIEQFDISPVKLLVLQGTKFCNINCSYCYLPDRSDTRKMSFVTLESALKGVADYTSSADPLTVLWHEGEPLVLGIPYFREAFQRARAILGSSVRLALQTNGTLITKDWIEVFKAFQVEVGLSCDGPPSLHDLARLARDGATTSAKVFAGATMIKESGLKLSIICVLGQQSLKRPKELFDFFETVLRADSVSFNIEETQGVHHAVPLFEDSNTASRLFLREYFQLAVERKAMHVVREFTLGIKSVVDGMKNAYAFEQVPFRVLTIGWQGDVTCFSPELLGATHPVFGPLTFGNVNSEGWFEELATRPLFTQVLNEIHEGNQICKASCDFFEECGGGVPSNKLFEHKTFAAGETHACQFYAKATMRATADVLAFKAEEGRSK